MTTVSDEFTVPLFRAHHREAHDCENEAAWWKASRCPSWRSRSARGDGGGRETGDSQREYPQGWPRGVRSCGQQVPVGGVDQLSLSGRLHPLHWNAPTV
jgi:hypothetical protein